MDNIKKLSISLLREMLITANNTKLFAEMMAKFFYKEPDTKEQVEAKIEVLSRDISRLLVSIEKMQHDLRTNHLEYTAILVRMKQQGLKESQQSVNRKKAQIEKYKIKLTKFKTVHLD